METVKANYTYESACEKELDQMWEQDVKGTNTKTAHRGLMKAIALNDQVKLDKLDEAEIHTKEMYDTEKMEWIPFDLWGASLFINMRKEEVLLRIREPLPYQSEFGDILYGWKTIDGSYLTPMLKEQESSIDKFNKLTLVSSRKEFCEIIKQDREEYMAEGRYSELTGNHINRRI